MNTFEVENTNLPFELSEYEGRVRKVQEKMADEGVEVMIVTSPTNMYYLTGYSTFSFYVPQFLVISLQDDLFMVPRNLDNSSVLETTWLSQDMIRPYGEDYIDHYHNYKEPRHPVEYLIELLREENLTGKVFGLEMDDFYGRALYYKKLSEKLTNASFQDQTQLISRLYLVKSEAEIEYMREASRIVEKGMEAAIDMIEDGVTEYDVAAEILNVMIKNGSCSPSFPPLLQTSAACHVTWTDKTIREGTSVSIEIAGCRKRYQSPMCRTAIVAKESSSVVQKAKDVMKRQIEAHRKALATVQPGIKAERVAIEANKIYHKRSSRVGYPSGLGFPPDWGEHTASFQEGDQTVLKPNMTFHVISTLAEPFMIEFGETVRVTEDGAEVLVDFPRKLFVR